MPQFKIILGSKSLGRRQILNSMGYEFMIMDPAIDEKAIRCDDPKQMVIALAYAKASALLPKITEPALLITADQVVRCNDKILEKPKDYAEAKEFLRLHTQFPAETICGVVVTNTATLQQVDGIDIAKVFFKPIPETMIEQIAAQEYVLRCAGGFSLDDQLLRGYISHIEGTEDSVTGLPIKLTQQLLDAVKHGASKN